MPTPHRVLRSIFLFAALAALAVGLTFAATMRAQLGDLQARVGELKESAAKNKQALAQYTWTERVTISLNGQERKQERFQVRIGPDGKPVKTPIDEPAQDQSARGGRLRQRVVEKKKEEYREYADQMKDLAQQYIPPEKDLIQDAYSKGNVSITPGAGGPSRIEFVIHNYIRNGDSATIIFDKDQKQLVSISIHSWMDDPSDVMNLSVRFDKLPDGTSHASGATIEGVRKHLTVVTQNDSYHKL
ncbi:MAG TPA: hypothetical protein VMP12_01195 [Candidatus Sulfotelmatobacter sp.]|nr:hypothetical protein [Candidatus Sulfotelmatobacter sp.]